MANNFFLNCENPTRLCTTLRAIDSLNVILASIGAVGTPVHLCSIEDWACPRLFLKDGDSNHVTHCNYLILHCTFFYSNQRFDFPHRLVATTCNLHRKYQKPFKIAKLKKYFLKTQKKIFREFSRNIYKNSRESRIQKSREFSKFLAREISREKP